MTYKLQALSACALLFCAGLVHGVVQSTDDFIKARDPFKAPKLPAAKVAVRSELELYSVESLKMIGVLTGPDHMRAMVLTPDGVTHLVSERMKIGMRDGFVKKITTEQIIVREKMMNIMGEEESMDTEIHLVAEIKPPVMAAPPPDQLMAPTQTSSMSIPKPPSGGQ